MQLTKKQMAELYREAKNQLSLTVFSAPSGCPDGVCRCNKWVTEEDAFAALEEALERAALQLGCRR